MKYSTQCDCCWQKVTAYSHKLNSPMIDALGKLIRAYKKKKRRIHIWKDIILSKAQYCNFQKLQYRGIVHRNNLWYVPTPTWIMFREWQVQLYTHMATLWKDILWFDHPAWKTHKSLPIRKFIREFDWQYSYKKREEYQSERGFRTPTLFW